MVIPPGEVNAHQHHQVRRAHKPPGHGERFRMETVRGDRNHEKTAQIRRPAYGMDVLYLRPEGVDHKPVVDDFLLLDPALENCIFRA